MLKLIITLFCLIVCIQCLNLCVDWTQYKEKCFKIFPKKTIQPKALEKCVQLNENSSLVTIYDHEEQQFINELLVQFNHISLNAWIGMEYNGHGYDWLDGTDTNFTNWSEDALKEGSDLCVRMSLMSRTLGKWTDSSCKRQALIVCQMRPILSLNTLKDFIEIMAKTNDKQRLDFEVKTKEFEIKINSLIPLGFIYTQLPEQSSPEKLWPNMNWSEITTEYSGLFFRAEGSGSETFGQIQQANQSLISTMSARCHTRNDVNDKDYSVGEYGTYSIKNELDGIYCANTSAGINGIKLYATAGEVRPKNTAIKIWKRIQ